MKSHLLRRPLTLLLVCFLSGCSLLPRPFTAQRAAKPAQPAIPVLMVLPSSHSLMNKQAGLDYAHDLAAALDEYGVPTTTRRTAQQSWQLQISGASQGQMIAPTYRIFGPDAKLYGQLSSTPTPTSSWKAGDPAVLSQLATRDSAPLSKLLSKINAQVQAGNPNSLANRTPRLFIGPVTGAPGDGNTALPADLTLALKKAPLELISKKEDADFSVTGIVKIVLVTSESEAAEIDWTIHDSNDRLVGQVTQLRDFKTSAISSTWGNTATEVAQEAANGVTTVIHNDIMKIQKTAKQ